MVINLCLLLAQNRQTVNFCRTDEEKGEVVMPVYRLDEEEVSFPNPC